MTFTKKATARKAKARAKWRDKKKGEFKINVRVYNVTKRNEITKNSM